MKKAKGVICIVVVVMLVAITGCGSGDTTNENEKVNVKVNVGTWKTAQTLTPYFYADFLPSNYDLEVQVFTNPGDQKTALLSGSLDMTGTTIPTTIVAASKDEPVKIVASLCNKCSALVVAKDSDIKSESDLKGKRIAYVPGTMHHVLLMDVLERAEIDHEKDVTLKRIDFFDMGQALAGGEIDAFLSGEPYPTQAVAEGYGRILSYPYFDDSIGTINGAMIVTEQMIEGNPELVEVMVDAHVDATKFENDNRDLWIDKSVEMGSDREILEQSKENIELCWDIDEEYISRCQILAEKMYELGMIDKVPDVKKMFDVSFLEKHH